MIDELMPPQYYFKWYRRPEPDRMKLYASIMEDYFANGLMIYELAVKYNITLSRASFIIGLYWRKPEFDLTIPSRV